MMPTMCQVVVIICGKAGIWMPDGAETAREHWTCVMISISASARGISADAASNLAE